MITDFVKWFQTTFALGGRAWIVEIFIIIVITMLLVGLVRIVYNKLCPRLEKSKAVWNEMFIKAVHKPLEYLIWVLGLSIAIEVISVVEKQGEFSSFLIPARKLGLIAFFTWSLIRLVNQVEEHYIEHKHKKIDRTTADALAKVVKTSIIITGVLVSLQSVGISVSGVLAFGGLSGAALAFAAKDLLANFFGGLIIYMDRPFAVGDWIRSPDRNIEGTVEYIGWRLCRIRTFDRRPLFIPNSAFSTIAIENPSRMLNRRISTNIGIRYKDAGKMHEILTAIEEMLHSHNEIDTNQLIMVNLVNFAPSSLEFMVYCFTRTVDWAKFQAVQQDVFLKIIHIIIEHGAECAFPSTTMHIPDGINIKQEHPQLQES